MEHEIIYELLKQKQFARNQKSTLLSSQATHRFNTSTYSFEKSYRWTVIHVISLSPRSRGNSINYTSVSFAMQIRFPWFTPQCFFPKLLHHHQQATWDSSKQETKTLYNWKPVKPLLTRRNTEENSSFFPPRRGDSYNYTDAEMGLQPEIGWSGTQIWGFRFILTWTEY